MKTKGFEVDCLQVVGTTQKIDANKFKAPQNKSKQKFDLFEISYFVHRRYLAIMSDENAPETSLSFENLSIKAQVATKPAEIIKSA